MSDELLGVLTEQLLSRLANLVADLIVQKLQAANEGMIGQEQSLLGRRRHCAAVQRRVAAGLPGAAIVGRKHLLSPEALREELSKQGPQKSPAPSVATPDVAAELATAIAQVKDTYSLPSIDKPKGSRRHQPSSSNTSTRNGAK